MPLKIRYLGHGKEVKKTPFDGTQEDAVKAAADGIGHENAEVAEILDEDDKLIAMVSYAPHA